MTPEQISKHAEKLRQGGVSMANYKQVLNDAFVLIREMADQIAQLRKKEDSK